MTARTGEGDGWGLGAPQEVSSSIEAVAFDFGGVLAEEGFRNGLMELGRQCAMDPNVFFQIGKDLVYRSGYVIGKADEDSFWEALRNRTGCGGTKRGMRMELLSRFLLRPRMFLAVQRLTQAGLRVVILSDQTNWLDELNRMIPFFALFHQVFNSYHLGKSKQDPSSFKDLCQRLDLNPGQVLFVDDSMENTESAAREGLRTVHFQNESQAIAGIEQALLDHGHEHYETTLMG